MKDTIITVKTKQREIRIFALCFAVAFGINIYSIISFDRSWVELFTQIGFVIAIAVTLYAIVTAIRLVIYLLRKVSKGK